jgi:hypothetical protein
MVPSEPTSALSTVKALDVDQKEREDREVEPSSTQPR